MARTVKAGQGDGRPRSVRASEAEVCLWRLEGALAARGWASASIGGSPPALRVFDARVPGLGETVAVVPAPSAMGAAVAWFRSSAGVLLGPCDDPERAAESVHLLLAPWGARALAGRG
ncbi:hypothetical protein GCM10023085_71140 [Actinomadura viridis]